MAFGCDKPLKRSGGILPRENWRDGWIVDKKQRIESPNHSGDLKTVYGIVTHYTACPRQSENNEKRITNWLSNKGKSSTHFVILRDGTILQGVSINQKAWHAGESAITVGGRVLKSLNNYAIGIDFDNVGPLKGVNSKNDYKDSYGTQWTYDRIYISKNSVWEPYTWEQICSYIDLCEVLCDEFKFGTNNIWGHNDVSPGRKIDPGDAFPWLLCRQAWGDVGASLPDLLVDMQKITCYRNKLMEKVAVQNVLFRIYPETGGEKDGQLASS